jgi:hypothetical protein
VLANEAGTSFAYKLGITTAACPIPTVLAGGAPTSMPAPGGQVAFEAYSPLWLGCAVRGTGNDWDLGLYDLPGGSSAPTCLGGLLAASSDVGANVDITVGDFNHTPTGWYFAYPHLFMGAGPASVEFTSSRGAIAVNDNFLYVDIEGTTLAHMYDVYLSAGRTYEVGFWAPAGGISLLLFANTAGGAYFTGRGGAVLSITAGTTYTAPVSGWYGIAIVNDGGARSSYGLAVGDCSQVAELPPNVPVSTGYVQNAYFPLPQAVSYWTAIGIRNTSTDWDLEVKADQAGAPWPSCTSLSLATSDYMPPFQDVIVGDFNLGGPGTAYLRAHQFDPAPTSPAVVQWDSGSDLIIPNDNNATTRTTGPDDIVGCWDVLLSGGQAYSFELTHTGSAALTLMLFRNPGTGMYWAGRAGAVLETGTSQTYTPPSSGYYGVVVINDDGLSDTYTVSVKTCDPIVAVPVTPVITGSINGGLIGSFTQGAAYWTPVAVRAVTATDDWDLAVYSLGTGGPIGVCASGLLATSGYGIGATDFVIGDFNYNPTGTYYAALSRWYGTGGAVAQYFPGSQQLVPGAAGQVRYAIASFVVESWDASLAAGQDYTVFFSHDPALDAKVCVFAPTGGVYWTGRSGALVQDARSVHFTAPVAGWYAIVVVSDGGQGTFAIGLGNGWAAVDEPQRPGRDALRALSPNPGRAGLRLDYALHEDGEAAFEILDMSGRLVSRFEPGARGAGEWSAAWPAKDRSGRPLRPGLYFVRMRVGDRTVGTRKLTLLE